MKTNEIKILKTSWGTYITRHVCFDSIEFPEYLRDRIQEIFEHQNKFKLSLVDNTVTVEYYSSYNDTIPAKYFDDSHIKYDVYRAVEEAYKEADDVWAWNSAESEYDAMMGR